LHATFSPIIVINEDHATNPFTFRMIFQALWALLANIKKIKSGGTCFAMRVLTPFRQLWRSFNEGGGVILIVRKVREAKWKSLTTNVRDAITC